MIISETQNVEPHDARHGKTYIYSFHGCGIDGCLCFIAHPSIGWRGGIAQCEQVDAGPKRLVLHPTGPTDMACTKPLTQQQQSRPVEDVVAEPVEMVAALSAGRHPTSVCMLRVAENGISPAILRPIRERARAFWTIRSPLRSLSSSLMAESLWLVITSFPTMMCLLHGFYDLPWHLLVSNFT